MPSISYFRIIPVVFTFAICGTPSAKQPIPGDIRTFIHNAYQCEHLAGEWDSNLAPVRKREIKRRVELYCATAQRQLRQVEAKYRRDRALSELIVQHSYDSVRSYSK